MPLGEAHPPTLFEEEPSILIFDRNDYIANPSIDLRPFNDIATIVNHENDLYNKLEDPNGFYILVLILPQWEHLRVRTFIEQRLLRYLSARLFCLFFINGTQIGMTLIAADRLIGCHSITSRILAQTLYACGRANDRNIIYCEVRRAENEMQGDVGVANLYATQMLDRVRRQCTYNERLEQEMGLQRFR